MPSTLTIELPTDVDLPPDVIEDTNYIRGALAAVLYTQGKISALQARRMMGIPRCLFEDQLASFGFSVMMEDDFFNEQRAAKSLADA